MRLPQIITTLLPTQKSFITNFDRSIQFPENCFDVLWGVFTRKVQSHRGGKSAGDLFAFPEIGLSGLAGPTGGLQGRRIILFSVKVQVQLFLVNRMSRPSAKKLPQTSGWDFSMVRK